MKSWRNYKWSSGDTFSSFKKATLTRSLLSDSIISIIAITFLYTTIPAFLFQMLNTFLYLNGLFLNNTGTTIFLGIVVGLYLKDVIKACLPLIYVQRNRFIWRDGVVEEHKWLNRVSVDEQVVFCKKGHEGYGGEKMIIIGTGILRKRFRAYRRDYL